LDFSSLLHNKGRLSCHRFQWLEQRRPACIPFTRLRAALTILHSIQPTSMCLSKVVTKCGYFNIPWDERNSYLTTFLLPSRCYQCTREPRDLPVVSSVSGGRTKHLHNCRLSTLFLPKQTILKMRIWMDFGLFDFLHNINSSSIHDSSRSIAGQHGSARVCKGHVSGVKWRSLMAPAAGGLQSRHSSRVAAKVAIRAIVIYGHIPYYETI